MKSGWVPIIGTSITRIEIKQEAFTRNCYTITGTRSHYQILLPIQLLEEILKALHGHNSNHPDITKIIQEARQKYYYPNFAKYIKKWVRNCKICIQTELINNEFLRTELLNRPEGDPLPKDIYRWIFYLIFVCLSSNSHDCYGRIKSDHGYLIQTYLPLNNHNHRSWNSTHKQLMKLQQFFEMNRNMQQ